MGHAHSLNEVGLAQRLGHGQDLRPRVKREGLRTSYLDSFTHHVTYPRVVGGLQEVVQVT